VAQHAGIATATATASVEESLQLFTNPYKWGVDTYLQVIAQTRALVNERNEVDISRRRMEASVLLTKALGGRWELSKLPQVASRGDIHTVGAANSGL
jgi:outer membrane protein TolC